MGVFLIFNSTCECLPIRFRGWPLLVTNISWRIDIRVVREVVNLNIHPHCL